MGRVAVIVVPGVGDDAPGDTLEVTRALVARPDVSSADLRRSLISPEADDAPCDLRWARVRPSSAGPDAPPEMDVFEMTWSDISRFPGGLLRFFGTLAGLLAQVSTIGLEALRPWARDSARQSASLASGMLSATSSLLVVPILALGLALAVQATLLWAALLLGDDHRILWRVILSFGLFAMLALPVLAIRLLRRATWPAAIFVAYVVVVFPARVSDWFFDDSGSVRTVKIANEAIIGSSVVFRGLWLVAVALAAAAVIALAVFVIRGPAAEATVRARAAFTALVSLVVAPIGVALTGAIIFASIAALGLQTLSGDWGGSTENLLCTSDPGAFFPRTCGTTPAPTDWALALLSQIAQPLVWALVIGIVPSLLIVGAIVAFAEPWIKARLGKGHEKERRLGDVLTSGLGVLTGRFAAVVLGACIIVGAALTVWVWLIDELPGFGSLELGGVSALSVSGLVIAARLLALGPRSTFSPLRGLLKRLRVVLDLPYDVATYLRIDGVTRARGRKAVDPPRELMLRRYRALLAHVAAGGSDERPYDGVVIASHSQGTVLTVAVLSGDSWREPVAEPLSATRPGLALPERISLLMFGSPLGQLYATRFPQQFAEFGPEGPFAWTPGGAGATDMWLNVYRAADPVGRSLWAPEFAGAHDPTRLRFAASWLGGPEVREACLSGTGGHTGYWGDAQIVDYLVYLTRRAAGADPAWPGPVSLA